MEYQALLLSDLTSFFPEILVSIAIFYILIYSVCSVSYEKGYPLITKSTVWLSTYVLLCLFLLFFNEGFSSKTLQQALISNDSFILGFRCITISASIFVLLSCADYLEKDRINSSEISSLILLSVLSSLILVGSNDLLTFYLSVEMQSLCFYVLATLKRNSSFSTEAGLKYFVLGAFSSGLLLFGCSLIYGFSGTTNFEEISQLVFHISYNELFLSSNGLVLGMLFVLIAFMFKLAAAPFHVWIPDVYEGSPTGVTAYFAIIPKIAIIALCLKFSLCVFGQFYLSWQPLIIFCSLSSLVLGCFSALYQRKIKRLLAFSAVVHSGYLLLALSCGSSEGIKAIILYVIIYVWMGIAIFSLLLSLRRSHNSSRVTFIVELMGISKANTTLSLSLALVLFSLAGIPPLAGFFSKLNVFLAAFGGYIYIPTIIALLFSALSAVYYIRIIKVMYFDIVKISWFSPIDKVATWILFIFLSLIVHFFLAPNHILVFIEFMTLGL